MTLHTLVDGTRKILNSTGNARQYIRFSEMFNLTERSQMKRKLRAV